MSATIAIELEDDVFLGLQKDPQTLGGEMRLAAAAKWYELGRVSQDKAAEIAGMSRSEFVVALGQFAVSPIQETVQDVLRAAGKR